jgi:hypothetical protein
LRPFYGNLNPRTDVLDARTRLLLGGRPWPATKDELIDFAMRTGAPLEVVENLQAIEDDEEVFESIEEIWPDYPSKEDFFFNEDEY